MYRKKIRLFTLASLITSATVVAFPFDSAIMSLLTLFTTDFRSKIMAKKIQNNTRIVLRFNLHSPKQNTPRTRRNPRCIIAFTCSIRRGVTLLDSRAPNYLINTILLTSVSTLITTLPPYLKVLNFYQIFISFKVTWADCPVIIFGGPMAKDAISFGIVLLPIIS